MILWLPHKVSNCQYPSIRRRLYIQYTERVWDGHRDGGRGKEKLTLSLVSRSFPRSVCQPPSVFGVQRRSVRENSSNSVKSLSVHCSLTDNLLSAFTACVRVCAYVYKTHTHFYTVTIRYWWHLQKPTTPAGLCIQLSKKHKLSLQFFKASFLFFVMLLNF